eukprot:1182500-Prorocentrum_minimum.AAC.2
MYCKTHFEAAPGILHFWSGSEAYGRLDVTDKSPPEPLLTPFDPISSTRQWSPTGQTVTSSTWVTWQSRRSPSGCSATSWCSVGRPTVSAAGACALYLPWCSVGRPTVSAA